MLENENCNWADTKKQPLQQGTGWAGCICHIPASLRSWLFGVFIATSSMKNPGPLACTIHFFMLCALTHLILAWIPAFCSVFGIICSISPSPEWDAISIPLGCYRQANQLLSQWWGHSLCGPKPWIRILGIQKSPIGICSAICLWAQVKSFRHDQTQLVNPPNPKHTYLLSDNYIHQSL